MKPDPTLLLTLNVGSSTVKLAAFARQEDGALRCCYRGQKTWEAPRLALHDAHQRVLVELPCPEPGPLGVVHALHAWVQHPSAEAPRMGAVVHRVVHGGGVYESATRVTPEVLRTLETFVPLAPLHMPPALEALHAVHAAYPDVPQWVCCDTAFHATQQPLATRLPIARHWHDEGVRRYGFHGLSYASVVRTLRRLAPDIAEQRLIIVHLGSGASACAVHQGRSVATTMGCTALDGLMMGTRTGRLDPGVLLYWGQQCGRSWEQIAQELYHASGLLGVSGVSASMHVLLERYGTCAQSTEAVDLFVLTAAQEIAGLVPILGGVDAIVWTGGIGEHAAQIRQAMVERWGWYGLRMDQEANARHILEAVPGRLDALGSTASLWVVPANEEEQMAEEVYGTYQHP